MKTWRDYESVIRKTRLEQGYVVYIIILCNVASKVHQENLERFNLRVLALTISLLLGYAFMVLVSSCAMVQVIPMNHRYYLYSSVILVFAIWLINNTNS